MGADGYRWWYLDALSEDGRSSLCIITFLGSVFSPYYAWARARAPADPLEHCAFNVALSGPRNRWCMTERPRRCVEAGPDALRIGRSRLEWRGGAYHYTLDERGSPLPWALRGTVRVEPACTPGVQFNLDSAGHHRWSPLAPCAHVRVELEEPRQRWRGLAYVDTNWGDRPLEQDFRSWQWSRTSTAAGTTVFYEPEHRSDAPWTLAVRFSGADCTSIETPPADVRLPRSGWGIARSARSEDPPGTRVVRTLLDAPFYARSLLEVKLAGASALSVHETLSLERFRQPWVRCMLPFRMPRLALPQRPAAASSAAR